ncbi:brachyurin-like [Condylostylus longicornis]|uniref:brachyurin-like n=1 Tax=Condylostylus longicornis TaxID=2530218 RepID=UPI00244E3B84|nr:brachyurin-like [Condylostylus longicornis]
MNGLMCQHYAIQSKIIGGDNVDSYELTNFVVGIYIDDGEWCGGSIISSKCVITAAHCLYEKNKAKLYFGYIRLSSPPSGAVNMNASHDDFIIHNEFSPITLANDIAGIVLRTTLSFTTQIIQPIQLFSKYDSYNYSLESGAATLCGWGFTSDSSTTLSDFLQYVDVYLMSIDSCKKFYPNVTKFNLCTTSGSNVAKGGCRGDSGHGLAAQINSSRKLIGILSFRSKNGCNSLDPRGYTNIVEYSNWICQNFRVC